MNDTPIKASPVEPPTSGILVSFHYSGKDNGTPKEGFDSRVISLPEDVKIQTSADVKAVADALAQAEFEKGKRFEGFEITILNLARLPI